MVSQLTNSIVGPQYSHEDQPRIITKAEHEINHVKISSNAIEVIDRLKREDYTSELVGGCVRDLLIDRQPKDFDVSTNARPEQIRALFKHCEVFGRRFQIAQVYLNGESIQVATYRRAPNFGHRRGRSRNVSARGKILKDNRFGEIREDAFRRDLTINSLYLHPSDMHIVDYTGGYDDAMNKTVRLIGDPAQRYREDPVRILRAIRFATLPDFSFHIATEQAIAPNARLLTDVSNFRLTDELDKLLFNGRAQLSFEYLFRHEVFRHLFPTYHWLHSGLSNNYGVVDWIDMVLRETDLRIRNGEHTSKAFTYAAVLWPNFYDSITRRSKRKRAAFGKIANHILNQQNERTFFSRHVIHRMMDIWQFQELLEAGVQKNGTRLTEHKIFRSAVRLFELRGKRGDVDENVCKEWVEIRDQQELSQHSKKVKFRRRRNRWQ